MPQSQPQPPTSRERSVEKPAITLSSPSFADGATIPKRYTADGENVSPALTWRGRPQGTSSFAIVCEDPDAPSGLFTHWLVWNVDASATRLDEGATGLTQGENGFSRAGWGGPSPPPGKPHRYVFRLYALDTKPSLAPGANRDAFDCAVEGHILGEAMLIGTYGR